MLEPDKEHPVVGPTYVNQVHEWQLCPKCNGFGKVPFGYVAQEYQPFNPTETCDLCNGKKIISKINGLPPQ